MPREITQRELRTDTDAIMLALDRGESFVVTRNRVPVGELLPMRYRQFVSADAVVAAFACAPTVEPRRFQDDLDAVLDQHPAPPG